MKALSWGCALEKRYLLSEPSSSPSPEDISVFLLPNLCCASKICSWAASRVEQAKPISVEKEGGGAGQGSDQTKKGRGERVLRPSKQASLLERTEPALLPTAGFSVPLASHLRTPGTGVGVGGAPFNPAFLQEGTPPPFKSSKQLCWGSSCNTQGRRPSSATCGVLTLCSWPKPDTIASVGPWQSTLRAAPTGPSHRHLFYGEQTHFGLNFLLLLSLRQTHLFQVLGSRRLSLPPSPNQACWQAVSWNSQLLGSSVDRPSVLSPEDRSRATTLPVCMNTLGTLGTPSPV